MAEMSHFSMFLGSRALQGFRFLPTSSPGQVESLISGWEECRFYVMTVSLKTWMLTFFSVLAWIRSTIHECTILENFHCSLFCGWISSERLKSTIISVVFWSINLLLQINSWYNSNTAMWIVAIYFFSPELNCVTKKMTNLQKYFA